MDGRDQRLIREAEAFTVIDNNYGKRPKKPYLDPSKRSLPTGRSTYPISRYSQITARSWDIVWDPTKTPRSITCPLGKLEAAKIYISTEL